jgi:DNA-binding response OmpR family regulator
MAEQLTRTPCTSAPSLILHGRRLRLSATQTRRLSALLAHPGRLVRGQELQVEAPASASAASAAMQAKAISRMREVLRPHGYDIYAVVGRGFLLAPLEEPEGKEGC